jgi:acyl-CoA synthetase (NDP forming)
MAHKTEYNIVHLNLSNDSELEKAYNEIKNSGIELTGILVQKMIKGNFELVMGLVRDPHFGPAVMLGHGGVFTELFEDVSFRIAPLTREDALEMMNELSISSVFKGYRGIKAIDQNILAYSLVNLGELALYNPESAEMDINPLIISDGKVTAVDALIILNN